MIRLSFARFSRPPATWGVAAATLVVSVGIAGCSKSDPTPPASPFTSFEPAANVPATFTTPRAAVPLSDGRIAFIANVVGSAVTDPAMPSPERFGVFLAASANAAPTLLYSGDKMVAPFDIDVSVDNQTLWIADMAGGDEAQGALISLPIAGGDPTLVATTYAPRGVTVGPDDTVFFTGRDATTRAPGLFAIKNKAVTAVVVGDPFVEPSGIAVLASGDVLVADANLGDNLALGLFSRSGILLVKDGKASVFASGFNTGYPAGIALTKDEKALIISGEAPDGTDAVYVLDAKNPSAAPTVVTDKIGENSQSSGVVPSFVEFGWRRIGNYATFSVASTTAGLSFAS